MKASHIILSICCSLIVYGNPAICKEGPLKPYCWSKVLKMPPIDGSGEGGQILHFKNKMKSYTKSKEATNFVGKYLSKAQKVPSDAGVLRKGSDSVTIEGAYLEMGVCTGKTINLIAGLNPHQKIYGFDSFEGLPEAWVRKDKTFKKGTFAFRDPNSLPPVLHNVHLYKGLFKDTLPQFKKAILKESPIAFLHIDSDIYNSAKTTLELLKDNFVDGTIIVFDEFYNYPGYENHEFKAFQEFLKDSGFDAEYIAFNPDHEQVALKLVRRKNS